MGGFARLIHRFHLKSLIAADHSAPAAMGLSRQPLKVNDVNHA
jgi:hypothetical protein